MVPAAVPHLLGRDARRLLPAARRSAVPPKCGLLLAAGPGQRQRHLRGRAGQRWDAGPHRQRAGGPDARQRDLWMGAAVGHTRADPLACRCCCHPRVPLPALAAGAALRWAARRGGARHGGHAPGAQRLVRPAARLWVCRDAGGLLRGGASAAAARRAARRRLPGGGGRSRSGGLRARLCLRGAGWQRAASPVWRGQRQPARVHSTRGQKRATTGRGLWQAMRLLSALANCNCIRRTQATS